MAKRYWIGGAYAIAQADTVQVTGYDASTTYKLTVGSLVISVIGAGGANATATALAAAWNLSEHPYAAAITASANTDTVTLTADVAGVPFVVTSSVSGGSGTIGSVTSGTANAGPNDFGTAANWSGNTTPVNGDDVELGNSAWPILWGLDQSAKTFATFVVDEGFADNLVGLNPNVFQTGEATTDDTVKEYRECYLKCGATIFVNRSATQRLLVDFGSVQTAATITNSASQSIDGAELEPIRLLGTHTSNALHVSGGTVGVATTQQQAEVSTFLLVTCGEGSAGGGAFTANGGGSASAEVHLGSGCTLTTISIGSGKVVNFGAAATTVNVTEGAGSYTCYGAGDHTTISNRGTVNYLTKGTLANYSGDGIFDTRQDARPKTVSNAVIYRGASFLVNTGSPLSVTVTNGVDVVGCGLADVTIDFGPNVTVTPSAL